MGVIGKDNYGFDVTLEDRERHTYIVGQTGTGKSSLLKRLAIEDIQAGKGVAYFDPHGFDAREILDYVPKDRLRDVIYFDAGDREHPIGFNPLEYTEDRHERALRAYSVLYALRSIWSDSWSASWMQLYTLHTLLVLAEHPTANFADTVSFVENEEIRDLKLSHVRDDEVLGFWYHYNSLPERDRREQVRSLWSRVRQFIADPFMRDILNSTHSFNNKTSIRRIMDEGKIIIFNLSKGKLDGLNGRLLGGLFISQFQYEAMKRDRDSRPFAIYVDEFQNLVNTAFVDTLSEARKYRLSLTLAHQYIGQLPDDIQGSVFGNVGNFICLRVGEADAGVIANHYTETVARQLSDLPNFTAYVRYLKDNGMSEKRVELSDIDSPRIGRGEEIIEYSRRTYARKK